MIAIVRITGDVNLRAGVRETLRRLNLGRKYSCTLVEENERNLGMLNKIRDFVAFGKINSATLKDLIKKRGQQINKKEKIKSEDIVSQLEKGKKLRDLGLKPFFRLHPPRKGIESKKHFGVGKGVLGNNKEKINDLVGRML